jgi:hypothetical protein
VIPCSPENIIEISDELTASILRVKVSKKQELLGSDASLLKMEKLRSSKRSNYTASHSRRIAAVTTSNPTIIMTFNFL